MESNNEWEKTVNASVRSVLISCMLLVWQNMAVGQNVSEWTTASRSDLRKTLVDGTRQLHALLGTSAIQAKGDYRERFVQPDAIGADANGIVNQRASFEFVVEEERAWERSDFGTRKTESAFDGQKLWFHSQIGNDTTAQITCLDNMEPVDYSLCWGGISYAPLRMLIGAPAHEYVQSSLPNLVTTIQDAEDVAYAEIGGKHSIIVTHTEGDVIQRITFRLQPMVHVVERQTQAYEFTTESFQWHETDGLLLPQKIRTTSMGRPDRSTTDFAIFLHERSLEYRDIQLHAQVPDSKFRKEFPPGTDFTVNCHPADAVALSPTQSTVPRYWLWIIAITVSLLALVVRLRNKLTR